MLLFFVIYIYIVPKFYLFFYKKNMTYFIIIWSGDFYIFKSTTESINCECLFFCTLGLSTQYDLPASFLPPPQNQRSLPPLPGFTPFIISSSEAGYDVPKNREAAKDHGSTDEEDVSQLRKKVEEKYQVPVVIKHSGESSS